MKRRNVLVVVLALLSGCVPWEPPTPQYGIQSAAWTAIQAIPFRSLCQDMRVTCESLLIDRQVRETRQGVFAVPGTRPIDFELDSSASRADEFVPRIVDHLDWDGDSPTAIRVYPAHVLPYGSGDTATFYFLVRLPGPPLGGPAVAVRVVRRERRWAVQRIQEEYQ